MLTLYSKTRDGELINTTDQLMQFPAGEKHIKEADDLQPCVAWVSGTDMNDYAAAAMWIDYAHRQNTPAEVTAVIPYLPAARADRGNPLGAKVYADLINAMHADRVVTLDPHSPVMPRLIENLEIYPIARVIRSAVGSKVAGEWETEYAGIIAPDAGALERATAAASALHLPLYQAGKKRDFDTGKLSGFTCEPLPTEGRFLVVDDICDGGGTFRGLAEATGLGPDRLDLWVTHGVFSGKADLLREHYGRIHTTDSHPGHDRDGVATNIHTIQKQLIRGVLL